MKVTHYSPNLMHKKYSDAKYAGMDFVSTLVWISYADEFTWTFFLKRN